MNYSLVPQHYKDKDPRTLLYHFPSIPVVKFAKITQKFYFFKQLEIAQDIVNRMGYILLPSVCMHWERVKQFAERRIKIGRNSFFMMKIEELTEKEKEKLNEYVSELRGGEKDATN
ncbi:hypothetical protein [Anoxybacillus flavithermus]|uniref:Uncharacterized conserved protein n=1 Tax=Anoxybacillus flavithermus (strain DSM 21510 / WK1) TaxID=491915 RepID=B7GK94_ANOFW|nr:hypothetical protein [Anoxybacillus flavithermus]ACJ33179.1 Uncharacterized conserved protein [Anoxybacillus flavithermus WK1]